MIISVFSFFHRSRACYIELQKVITLPSIRLMKDNRTCLSNSSSTGNLSLSYLKNKVKCLDHKLLVNIQLDEVYIKHRN